jgi:hypothetical protein
MLAFDFQSSVTGARSANPPKLAASLPGPQ